MPSRIRLQKYILFCFLPKEKPLFSPFTAKKRLKSHLSQPFFFRFPPQKKKKNMLQPVNWDTFSFSLLKYSLGEILLC